MSRPYQEFGAPMWDYEAHETTRRLWVPEAGGWIYVFSQDRMRMDIVTAAVFVPRLASWRSAPLAPVSLALDLSNVTREHQPVPLGDTHGQL